MNRCKRKKNIVMFFFITITIFSNLAYLESNASQLGTMSVLVKSAYDLDNLSVDSIAYNDTNGWIQVVLKGPDLVGWEREDIKVTSNEITGITLQKQKMSNELQVTGDFSKLYTPSLNLKINENFIGSRVLYEMQNFVDNIFAPSNPIIDEETTNLIRDIRNMLFVDIPAQLEAFTTANPDDFVASIENYPNVLILGHYRTGLAAADNPEKLKIIYYDGSFHFEENGEREEKIRYKVVNDTSTKYYIVSVDWIKDDFSSVDVLAAFDNVTTEALYEPWDLKFMSDMFVYASNKPLSYSGLKFHPNYVEIPNYLEPDFNIDDATNTNALHTIELINQNQNTNSFSFQALVDSRACDNRLFVTFDSASPLSANYRADITHDDVKFYIFDLIMNLDVNGEKEETIRIKYGGDEVFSKPFLLNNTSPPVPSVSEDIFYLRTLEGYIDFILETNSKNLDEEVDAYRLIDDSNQATVKDFPSYYKRFEEELEGYSQPRFRYTFRFPSESFATGMFLRGQIDFSDGTQMISNNMIDYQLKTWGDTGEYVQDTPIYDVIPDIDDEQINDTVNKAKDSYNQTVQEMEQSPFGQKMKAFFGANWLLMVIGIVVVVIILWG